MFSVRLGTTSTKSAQAVLIEPSGRVGHCGNSQCHRTRIEHRKLSRQLLTGTLGHEQPRSSIKIFVASARTFTFGASYGFLVSDPNLIGPLNSL
jgi:hypothetical protein